MYIELVTIFAVLVVVTIALLPESVESGSSPENLAGFEGQHVSAPSRQPRQPESLFGRTAPP